MPSQVLTDIFSRMPTEAVEKPLVEEGKHDDSGSGSDTDSEDSMPDLEDQDVAQQSRVSIGLLLTFFSLMDNPNIHTY